MDDELKSDELAVTNEASNGETTSPGTSRRDVLTALAVCGCCLTIGGSFADAAPGDGPGQGPPRGPGGGNGPGGGGGGAGDRVPPPKPGVNAVGVVGDYAKDGIYDKYARTVQVFLVRENDTLHAMSSVCTHKRCIVRKKDEATLRCPCHQAEYDKDGIVSKPPAKMSLVHYAISVDGGKVSVDTSKSFEEKNWGDPAASVKLDAVPATMPA